MSGNDWAWQGRELKTVTASLDGTLAEHRLRLEASGPGHGLSLALTGGWSDPDWRGRLATLDWELPETGAWTLSVPVEVTAGREMARLAPACWTQATAELCLEGQAEQAYAAWQAEASLNGLPLNRLQPWLPVDVEFDSSLSATATAAQQAAAEQRGRDQDPGRHGGLGRGRGATASAARRGRGGLATGRDRPAGPRTLRSA
ncbi:hypothetical protein [Thiohalobacter thiocyanaticus]|uniref:hypothetical protein n=1 Tax=Thiohalobacter thiocyanaticus TaxID=585455 RepID=UPI00131A2E80|nr:hypothetical protein [Thiohalobacter thiocyanaticus]